MSGVRDGPVGAATAAREKGAAVPGVEAVTKRLTFEGVTEDDEPQLDGFSWVPSSLCGLKRKALQSLAKRHGVKANGKSAAIIAALTDLYQEARAEQAGGCDAVMEGSTDDAGEKETCTDSISDTGAAQMPPNADVSMTAESAAAPEAVAAANASPYSRDAPMARTSVVNEAPVDTHGFDKRDDAERDDAQADILGEDPPAGCADEASQDAGVPLEEVLKDIESVAQASACPTPAPASTKKRRSTGRRKSIQQDGDKVFAAIAQAQAAAAAVAKLQANRPSSAKGRSGTSSRASKFRPTSARTPLSGGTESNRLRRTHATGSVTSGRRTPATRRPAFVPKKSDKPLTQSKPFQLGSHKTTPGTHNNGTTKRSATKASSRSKFNLEESLKRPLSYKPYSGRYTPGSENGRKRLDVKRAARSAMSNTGSRSLTQRNAAHERSNSRLAQRRGYA